MTLGASFNRQPQPAMAQELNFLQPCACGSHVPLVASRSFLAPRAVQGHLAGLSSDVGKMSLIIGVVAREAVRRTKPKGKPMPLDQSTYPAKDLCSRCGFCNTSLIGKVQDSCAFLGEGMARIDHLEEKVHGRRRRDDELYFGVQVEAPKQKKM